MKWRWKGLLIGYIITYVFYVILVISYHSPYYSSLLFYLLIGLLPIENFFHLISMPLGFYLGWVKENKEKGRKKLEEQHLLGIKQLLKEHKSLTQIKKKIQGWKDKGYDVSELENMLENVESVEVEFIESGEVEIEK